MTNADMDLMDADFLDSSEADWDCFADIEVVVIPLAVQQAAQDICTQYEGFVLTSIKPEADNMYVAWYIDTTAHPEEDWYTMFREFRFVDNKAVDIHE